MPTILLIDDDVALMERVATCLSEAGYTVLRASRVQHAELLLAEQRSDLVLLDPDIGHGDGWLLLDRSVSVAPVIVISGQALEEDIIRGLDAGAVDYLPKPFRTGEMLARVRVRLRERPPATPPAEGLAQPSIGPTTRLDAPPSRPPMAGRDTRGAIAPGDVVEPVFISHGEEERLLRDPRPRLADDLGEIGQLPLGQRLHAARQRKRITLVQAELETRPSVPMHYIQAMEEEKFSLLPRGPLAEELLRSYASYLGVDVSATLDEYRRLHYNAPVAPPASLGGSPPPWRLPRWIVWLVAAALALVVGLGGIWLYDPHMMTALAGRAGILALPPTPTATVMPTATVAPTATATPRPSPTATPRPSATAAPTATVAPTERPTATPRRRG